ncbi:MAG: alpha-galactosidase [bacterium]
MIRNLFTFLLVFLFAETAFPFSYGLYTATRGDWLVSDPERPAVSREAPNHADLILDNGLVARVFRTHPNFATVDIINRMNGDSVLRGVKPEAVVVIDGKSYDIGGLKGQPDFAYLDPEWLEGMENNPDAFQFSHYETGQPRMRYPWKPKRFSEKTPWPPRGVALTAHFTPPAGISKQYEGMKIKVHYELYKGIPVLAKWVTIDNGCTQSVTIDSVTCEILAVNEEQKHFFHAESNYAFAGMETDFWGYDLEYTSQTDYLYHSPILYNSRYPLGPGVRLKPGETFETYVTFELLFDSDDRERQGLFRRRMLRTLMPQITENPIFMHVRNSDSESVRLAIDQCAETGFEMLILTFWSGFNIESEEADYIATFKADVDYAHGKGIEIGGYTLMCASRDVGDENNCIDPKTGKTGSKFGQSACLATEWSDGYFQRVLNFIDATGMDMIETDGPYHGDVCASSGHKYHHGLEDSQFQQWKRCVNFYAECLKRGMYINTPDRYFYNGAQKLPMGYRETNWSLPRWRQILIARQNIFDATYLKPPSLGWMFVPLVEYHGGGAPATLEPLSEHLTEYEWHLALNFGSGVIACYRGPRLYDTDETKEVVKKWVEFYKKYRDILTSDIIHVRRPDHKSVDCILHVNPELNTCGLAMVYNPLDHPVETTLNLPLYYTGLTETANIREGDGLSKEYTLDREYTIDLSVKMDAKSITWFVIEK